MMEGQVFDSLPAKDSLEEEWSEVNRKRTLSRLQIFSIIQGLTLKLFCFS